VHEINSTECPSDQWENVFPSDVDHGARTAMGEDVVVSQLSESKLNIIGVRAKVLHAVKSYNILVRTIQGLPGYFQGKSTLAKTSKCLEEIFFASTLSTACVHTPEMNCPA
jgi:hypothetical protein